MRPDLEISFSERDGAAATFRSAAIGGSYSDQNGPETSPPKGGSGSSSGGTQSGSGGSAGDNSGTQSSGGRSTGSGSDGPDGGGSQGDGPDADGSGRDGSQGLGGAQGGIGGEAVPALFGGVWRPYASKTTVFNTAPTKAVIGATATKAHLVRN